MDSGGEDRDTSLPMSLDDAREASLVMLSGAWTELRGYVAAAVEDGVPIDARRFAAYMDELKHRARTPLRETSQRVMNGG